MLKRHCFVMIFLIFMVYQFAFAQDPGQPDEIIVGNLDGSSILAETGEVINIPVWVKTDENVIWVGIPIATEDSFVSYRLGGNIFYPLTEWFDAGFCCNINGSPNANYSTEAMFGVKDIWPPPDNPPLNTNGVFMQVAEFTVQINTDFVIVGDSTQIILGYVPRWGANQLYFGDSTSTSWVPQFTGGIIKITGFGPVGSITGIITDQNSNPISNVRVIPSNSSIEDTTDVNGEYFISNIPASAINVEFSHPDYNDKIMENIIISENDTTALNVTMYEIPAADIAVWYGNLDSSPITAVIGNTVEIDVYVQTRQYINIAFVHLALGVDDLYVDSLMSQTSGSLYFPFDQWDVAEFLNPEGSPPNPAGWSSQSFLGFANIYSPHDDPWLRLDAPTKVLTFAAGVINDTLLIGDSVECIGAGLHSINGSSGAGDSTGFSVSIIEYFSPIRFILQPEGCDYIIGDVNGSDSYNGLDVTYGVAFLKGGPIPQYECECAPGDTWFVSGDVNNSCSYNGLDITYGVAYFKGGAAPVPCASCPPN